MAYQSMATRAAGYIVKAATDWNVVVNNFQSLFVGLASGDVDYYSSATTKARLAIGTEGQVLTVSGGVPAWGAGLPSGAIIDYGGAIAPTGWLACDGAAVSRSTYSALFSAVGTIWGAGNGSTTFNVPNFARRTTIGSGGTATATISNTVGSTGGAEGVALSIAELATHNHTYTRALVAGNDDSTGTGLYYNSQNNDSTTTGNAGSGTAHNNIQPSAVVLKIIKA
jgi:microcystin-dependent protein